ncbi:MAG: hypothetical protein HQ515_00605 [Phycisphaeraceae bacterium]|nr:hypothetical protein [Phycisphaeraceae bacterium]
MALAFIDWLIIGGFLAVIILIGIVVSRRSASTSAEYFLGGRNMPWWLLGVSMVACTFSCDTPNLVTGLVRDGGVVANWGWWAFLITGMVTVFIYAQLWRRSKVMTDLEFYEIRYSGKSAAFIRGFRSLYLGIFFNCLIMGSVTLAAIKIGQVIFDVDPIWAVIFGSVGVVIYATAGGIKSCIWADFFQYSIAMFGAIYAAIVACRQPEIGGLSTLLTHPDVVGKLSWMPDFSTWLAWVPMLLIPVAVQWWAVWYPGAEPGGGGYIAQRMLSAKDEKNAIGATMLFNFMHYAVRPWPWIIVALASIILYPDLASIKAQFPGIDPSYLKEDIAYPVMISRLEPGFLGLVVASLIAAYMSTIGTHLNWGSSYAVNDFYKRFLNPNATEKQLVGAGRIVTVVLMVIAAVFALTFLEDATQAFKILLLSGAGTGAIYIIRWFWWRINAWTEIVAMVVATVVAFWIVLGVGENGTLKWYINNASVQDRVFAVQDAEMVNTINTRIEDGKEETEALAANSKTYVATWRKAKKDPLARDQARFKYDAVNKIETDHKNSLTIMALLKAQNNIEYAFEVKSKEAVETTMAEEKALEATAGHEATATTYEAVVARFSELKAAKTTAADITNTALAAYGVALEVATSYDDAALVAGRNRLAKADENAYKAKQAYGKYYAKYGQTVASVKNAAGPAWLADFNSFVSQYGNGVQAIVKGDTIYVYESKVAGLTFSVQLLVCVISVTIAWILATFVTPAVDKKTLRSFYRLCHPGGPGWRKVVLEARADGEEIDQKDAIGDWKLPMQILCVFLGCVTIYACLFSVGNFIYGNNAWGFILIAFALVSVFALFKCFGKIGVESED